MSETIVAPEEDDKNLMPPPTEPIKAGSTMGGWVNPPSIASTIGRFTSPLNPVPGGFPAEPGEVIGEKPKLSTEEVGEILSGKANVEEALKAMQPPGLNTRSVKKSHKRKPNTIRNGIIHLYFRFRIP